MPELIEYPPPDHLSDRAAELWRSVVPSRVSTPSRRAMVLAGLESLDRANKAQAVIDTEGLTVKLPNGKMVHKHPLLKTESENRALFLRTWARLNLHWERR